MRALLLAACLLALPLAAQITVTVSRPVPLSTDQVYAISISTNSASLETLQSKLPGAILSGVTTNGSNLSAQFTLTVPAAQVAAQDAMLRQLAIPDGSFYLNWSRSSATPASEATNAAILSLYPALIAEARARAAANAAAAGMTLGNVLAVSEAPRASAPTAIAGFLLGTSPWFNSTSLVRIGAPAATLTVTFAAARY